MTAESTAPPALPETPPRAPVRRLHRSRTNRALAGVCGGIAEYYGSDPTAVRLAALIIGLFTGALLVLVGIAGFANVWLHVDWNRVWPLVLIGLGAVIVVATLRPRSWIRPLTRSAVRRTLPPRVAPRHRVASSDGSHAETVASASRNGPLDTSPLSNRLAS